jgi:hypothetical protein
VNIRTDEDGYIWVWCHKCRQEMELGDLKRNGNDILCRWCDSHLGYAWDLPSWALNYL